MSKKQLTNIERAIDYSTGEIVESKENLTMSWDKEPPFVKMYLNTILYLQDLPKGHNSILLAFLKHMTYAGTNEPQAIYVNSAMKKRIGNDLNVSQSRINNVISDLTKGNVFVRIDRGTYRVNPNLFGKGDWHDIAELRLNVTFDSNGKTIMSEVKKKTSKDKLRLVK